MVVASSCRNRVALRLVPGDSATMIIRMWFIHRERLFFAKLLWSLFLLVPVFGWFFYAGLFRPPEFNPNQCPNEHPANVGGGHI